jgi:hypothetical protein
MCNAVCRLKINEVIYRIAWVNFGLCIDDFQKTFRNLLYCVCFRKRTFFERIFTILIWKMACCKIWEIVFIDYQETCNIDGFGLKGVEDKFVGVTATDKRRKNVYTNRDHPGCL